MAAIPMYQRNWTLYMANNSPKQTSATPPLPRSESQRDYLISSSQDTNGDRTLRRYELRREHMSTEHRYSHSRSLPRGSREVAKSYLRTSSA